MIRKKNFISPRTSVREFISVKFIFSLFFFFTIAALSSCRSKDKLQLSAATTTSSRPSGSTAEDVKFKGYFLNGCKQKALGNYESAAHEFKEALKVFPYNSAANYELACIYKLQSKNAEALPHAKAAVEKDLKNEWYHLLLIDCLHEKKRYADAALACEKLIQINPHNSAFYDQLAKEWTYAGNYNKAVKTYNTRLEKFGFDPQITLDKIKILKFQGKTGEAEKELIALIKKNPSESSFYTYLAELYQENKQDEKAMDIYRELSVKDPKNPYVKLALADYYRSRNKDSLFLKEVKAAFEMPELEVEQKRKIMISFYSVTEEYPEHKQSALELCEIMVNIHPEDARAHGLYGDFLLREGDLEKARTQYEEALKTDKNIFGIWTEIMKIDATLRDYSSLEKHSEEAKELFTTQPILYYYNGVAKQQLKKNKEAVDAFLEAKEYIVDDQELLIFIFINLGETYHSIKEYEKSDNAFNEALRMDPNNASVMNNYSYYLSLRKEKLDDAEKMAKKANELVKDNSTFLDTYGWVLFQKAKYADAKDILEKALKFGGVENGVILEHYGDTLYKNGFEKEALEYWKKAKEKSKHSDVLDKKISEKKFIE